MRPQMQKLRFYSCKWKNDVPGMSSFGRSILRCRTPTAPGYVRSLRT